MLCNALHSPSDRIVYLNKVEKGINIFSKKDFLRGAQKNCAPPTQMLSYAPGWRFKYMNGLKLCRQPLLKGLSRDPFIHTFCKHMMSPIVAVLSTVKHYPCTLYPCTFEYPSWVLVLTVTLGHTVWLESANIWICIHLSGRWTCLLLAKTIGKHSKIRLSADTHS